MTDVFREVRERVSAEDAARHYGLTFDRRGWALCPFHGDRHPSMSFRAGRFHCWACNASGDSIDFTGRFLGLDNVGAVRRLNTDFGLALPIDRPPTAAEKAEARRRLKIAEEHRAFEVWRSNFIDRLNAGFRVAHAALMWGGPFSDREALAIKWQACFVYWADTLADGTAEEQMQIFRERRCVEPLIDRILNNSRMNSAVN